MGFFPKAHKNPIFTVILGVFLITLTMALAFWARNLDKQNYYIGKNPQLYRKIAISGEGKVTAIPDVATVTLGMENTDMNVQIAQKNNTTAINSLIAQLKDLGIAKEDIQTTGYNIFPQYDYSYGRQNLKGYTVSQNVMVKIRNMEKIENVLKIAGDLKLNQVYGLSFKVDQPEKYRQEAREKALQNAKEKAEALSKIMGVALGKVISFSEYGSNPDYYSYDMLKSAEGMGGGGSAPAVSPGSQEIIVNANVVYELD